MQLKKIISFLHLWTGLVTGLIVFIISVTGCITAFNEELFDAFHADLVKVSPGTKPLSLALLKENAAKAIPKEQKISSIEIYSADKSYVFIAQKLNKKPKGIVCFDQVKYWNKVYVNPYTGKVLGQINYKYEFFNIVLNLHKYLLLIKPIGSVVTGVAVLLFFLLLITGFVLWLPKKWKNVSKRLKIGFKGKAKKINYNLHSVLGVYVLPFALIIVVTGLTWSFKWWEAGMLKMLGAHKKEVLTNIQPTPAKVVLNGPVLDLALANLRLQAKDNFESIGITIPAKTAKSASGFIILKDSPDGWHGMNFYSIDHNTGQLFDHILQQDKSLAMKWRNSNESIHTGRIYGWPTQLLAFLASLICASLPVTGLIIWLSRKKKKHYL